MSFVTTVTCSDSAKSHQIPEVNVGDQLKCLFDAYASALSDGTKLQYAKLLSTAEPVELKMTKLDQEVLKWCKELNITLKKQDDDHWTLHRNGLDGTLKTFPCASAAFGTLAYLIRFASVQEFVTHYQNIDTQKRGEILQTAGGLWDELYLAEREARKVVDMSVGEGNLPLWWQAKLLEMTTSISGPDWEEGVPAKAFAAGREQFRVWQPLKMTGPTVELPKDPYGTYLTMSFVNDTGTELSTKFAQMSKQLEESKVKGWCVIS